MTNTGSISSAKKMSRSHLYPIPILAMTGICNLGAGRAAIAAALRSASCGLRPNRFADTGRDLPGYVGEVDGLEAVALPPDLSARDCRNNRLAWLALQQDDFDQEVAALVQRFGPSRIGVFVGTSTAGILDTETTFRHGRPEDLEENQYGCRHSLSSLDDFVAVALGLSGPRQTVSTACSSSAKVFGTAARHLAAGLCDAALVGGVDSLCHTTLYGFSSLELLSPLPTRPFSADRRGISIGEAAAFSILVAGDSSRCALLGVGESSDGHHMSTPHPTGLGARLAMHAALDSAGLAPGQIDYLNLHGTGTPANDDVEARAVVEVFGASVVCSSTKGAMGHCLGAAGAIDVLVCDLALEYQFAPATVGTGICDLSLPLRPLIQPVSLPLTRAMSNSFGFGGSNCSVILGAL